MTLGALERRGVEQEQPELSALVEFDEESKQSEEAARGGGGGVRARALMNIYTAIQPPVFVRP